MTHLLKNPFFWISFVLFCAFSSVLIVGVIRILVSHNRIMRRFNTMNVTEKSAKSPFFYDIELKWVFIFIALLVSWFIIIFSNSFFYHYLMLPK